MLDRAAEQLLTEDNQLPIEVQSDLLVTLGLVYLNTDALDKANHIGDVLLDRWSSNDYEDSSAYARTYHGYCFSYRPI